TMSIPDDLMRQWFELLTDRPLEEILRLTNTTLTHPMEAKKTLAADIVSFYYGPNVAQQSRVEWEKRFSQRQDPTEIPEVAFAGAELKDGKMWICKLRAVTKLTESNKEGRRAVEGGAVSLGPERTAVTDWQAKMEVTNGLIVRNGKRKIA